MSGDTHSDSPDAQTYQYHTVYHVVAKGEGGRWSGIPLTPFPCEGLAFETLDAAKRAARAYLLNAQAIFGRAVTVEIRKEHPAYARGKHLGTYPDDFDLPDGGGDTPEQ